MMKKIAYITDIHLDESLPIQQGVDARKNWQIILNDIHLKGITEVIFGGDIGEKSANKWFFDSLKDFNLDISLGNHDSFTEVLQHFNVGISKDQAGYHYSREYGFHKFIFLDTSTAQVSTAQLEWFKNELLTSNSILLFVHHPILAIEAAVDKKYSLSGRDKIKDALLDIKNDVTIFSGHYHLEDYSTCENITQIITPAGSYQLDNNPNEILLNSDSFGYRVIDIFEDQIKTELVLF